VSAYQVGPETFLTLKYQVFDAEGEAASEPEIVASLFGLGQLIPGVESALEGHSEGETVEVTLKPKDAFGERDPKSILEVDRGDFPDDVSPGDRFDVENEEGGLLVLHVLDVQDDLVVVDTNHPLADQEVKFSVEILEVRPASSEEISAFEAEMEEEGGALNPGVPLVSAESLIRGATKR